MADSRGTRKIACPGKVHFDVDAGATGKARVHCRAKNCRHSPREIVVHHFDLATGELTETRRYSRWPQEQTSGID